MGAYYYNNTKKHQSITLPILHYLDDTDYFLEPSQLMFSTGSQSVCINVIVLDDLIVELEEMFTVTLSTIDDRITFTIDTAVIIITENDDSGKQ